MPRLDYLATLRDNASPGLRALTEVAEGLGDALGGVSSSGSGLTQSLTRGISGVVEGFRELNDSIQGLTSIRLLTAALGGAFNVLTRSIRITVSVVNTLFAGVNTIINAFNLLVSVVGKTGEATGTFGRVIGRVVKTAAPLLAGLAALDLLFNRGRVATAAFSKTLSTLTETVVDLVAVAVPAVGRGLLTGLINQFGPLLARLQDFLGSGLGVVFGVVQQLVNRFATTLRDSIDPATVSALKGYAVELSNVGEAAHRLDTGPRFPREAAPVVRDLTKAALELAGQALVPLVLRFQEVSETVGTVLEQVQGLSALSVETAVGNIRVLPSAVRQLFASTGAAIEEGKQLTTAELVATFTAARQTSTRQLQALGETLAGGAGMAVLGLSQALGLADIRIQLQQRLSEIVAITAQLTDTSNLNNENLLMELRARRDIASEAYNDLLADYEKFQEAITGADKKANAEKRRRDAQATAAQLQAFLRASGQLVQGNQDLAITLAAIDAGVAITGALAYGTRYGPVYQALYVATTLANLANTINSIRSASLPTGLGGGSAPAVSDSVPQQTTQTPAQISLTIQSERDTFSAAEVRRFVGDINEAQSGQLAV